MAKDDYCVIAAKILVYLYARLKGKTDEKPVEYLHPLSKDFPISEEYLHFVISDLERHEYITVPIVKAWSGEIVRIDYGSMQITQEGIDFLSDNSKIRKVLNMIPMAAAIFESFQ